MKPAAFFCLHFQMLRHARITLDAIARLGELTKREIQVYIFLMSCRNERTGQCTPKRSAIVDRTGVSKSHVSEAIAGLERKGWIEADGRSFVLPDVEKVPKSGTISDLEKFPNRELMPKKSSQIGNKKFPNREQKVPKSGTPLNIDLKQRSNNELTNGAPASPDVEKVDPKKIIFGEGIPLFTRTGKSRDAAARILSKAVRDFGADDVAEAIQECVRLEPVEPVGYLNSLLQKAKAARSAMYVGKAFDAAEASSWSPAVCPKCKSDVCLGGLSCDRRAAAANTMAL